MPIMFNTILQSEGLDLGDVRLLRHQDNRAERGATPYELWRDDRPKFEIYQSHQRVDRRANFSSLFWATFVGTPENETMFVGLYGVKYGGLLEHDTQMGHMASTHDVYNLTLDERLHDVIGKMIIDWGAGTRAWVQRADQQNKAIKELRKEFNEPEFPGFLNFLKPLSELGKIPKGWVTALQFSKGVYLLTCPKTREQYVGSASGDEGFWNRWRCYVQTGHGQNVALKSRAPSDYRVSILEVAGTASTADEILAMEQRWKAKLQSRKMGLNRN
jgi:hypothetical protein